MKQDLGKLLLENEQISPEQLEQATVEAMRTKEPISSVLLRLGLVNEDIVKTVLELHYAVNYLNLKKIAPNLDIISALPWQLVMQHQMIPVSKEDNRLTVAMVNPSDTEALTKAKEHLSGVQIRTVVCSDDGFQDFIIRLIPQETQALAGDIQAEAVADSSDSPSSTFISLEDDATTAVADDGAMVRLCNHILSNALARGCTNIHIEPAERQILVHYRKEGVLFSARKLPRAILPDLISRFKNMSSAGNQGQVLPYD